MTFIEFYFTFCVRFLVVSLRFINRLIKVWNDSDDDYNDDDDDDSNIERRAFSPQEQTFVSVLTCNRILRIVVSCHNRQMISRILTRWLPTVFLPASLHFLSAATLVYFVRFPVTICCIINTVFSLVWFYAIIFFIFAIGLDFNVLMVT